MEEQSITTQKSFFDRILSPQTRHLWIQTIVLGLVFITILLGIFYSQTLRINSILLGSSLAWTAVILIGLSMILSGVSYFWDFADKYLVYRKQLGVVGFGFGLVHASISLLTLSTRFNLVEYLTRPDSLWKFLPADIAILIMTMMVIVSTKKVIHKIGGVMWRRLLRVGYLAYILIIVHFVQIRYRTWENGLESLNYRVFIELILFFFALSVLVMRIALEISLRNKKRQTKNTVQ